MPLSKCLKISLESKRTRKKDVAKLLIIICGLHFRIFRIFQDLYARFVSIFTIINVNIIILIPLVSTSLIIYSDYDFNLHQL